MPRPRVASPGQRFTPTFSLLHESYRRSRQLSVAKLYRLVKAADFYGSYDLVRRYASGQTNPQPDYVIIFTRVVQLSQDEAVALYTALVGDYLQSLYDQFMELSRRLNLTQQEMDGLKSVFGVALPRPYPAAPPAGEAVSDGS